MKKKHTDPPPLSPLFFFHHVLLLFFKDYLSLTDTIIDSSSLAVPDHVKSCDITRCVHSNDDDLMWEQSSPPAKTILGTPCH